MILSHMDTPKYNYQDSYLYNEWMSECGLSEETIALDVRIAKRVIAILEYIRRALLRSEESCLESVNLGRAAQLATSITATSRNLSKEAIAQMLGSIQSNAILIEKYLLASGATISKNHSLEHMFSQRDNSLSM